MLIFSAGNWDFHVFYHWEWDFLNASGNGEKILKIATGISRYRVLKWEWDFVTNKAGKMGSGSPTPPSGPSSNASAATALFALVAGSPKFGLHT